MQTLKEKAKDLKEQLQELAKTVSNPNRECGRDSETANPPQRTSSFLNWNKGWGKYGKT